LFTVVSVVAVLLKATPSVTWTLTVEAVAGTNPSGNEHAKLPPVLVIVGVPLSEPSDPQSG
jgi:hypothetical protein